MMVLKPLPQSQHPSYPTSFQNHISSRKNPGKLGCALGLSLLIFGAVASAENVQAGDEQSDSGGNNIETSEHHEILPRHSGVAPTLYRTSYAFGMSSRWTRRNGESLLAVGPEISTRFLGTRFDFGLHISFESLVVESKSIEHYDFVVRTEFLFGGYFEIGSNWLIHIRAGPRLVFASEIGAAIDIGLGRIIGRRLIISLRTSTSLTGRLLSRTLEDLLQDSEIIYGMDVAVSIGYLRR